MCRIRILSVTLRIRKWHISNELSLWFTPPVRLWGVLHKELQVVSRVAVTKCLACAEAEIYDLSKHF